MLVTPAFGRTRQFRLVRFLLLLLLPAVSVVAWLGLIGRDGAYGLECEVDVLDAQSNSASSELSCSAWSRAAPAFAPFQARRDPNMPPLLRGAVKPVSGEKDSHETRVLSRSR